MIDDNDPFIELPTTLRGETAIYIRRSHVVVLESTQQHSYAPGYATVHGTEISFRINDRMTTRFIPLSPQEVMARLDQQEVT